MIIERAEPQGGTARTRGLTKTDYMSGVQCHKLLWLRRHEPNAPELQPDKVLEDLFDQGNLVGALARDRFPGGVLVPYQASRVERARLTEELIAAGHTIIFEGSFLVDDIFVACDVLLREGDEWCLIEVKSSTKQKDEHIADLAVQVYVLSRCGLLVSRAEVMHLNPAFRHPDVGNLFARTDVTAAVMQQTIDVPDEAARQIAMLAGPEPSVQIGIQCSAPWDCVFHDRCWPDDPQHIALLYNVGPKKAAAYMARGIHRIDQVPAHEKLPFAARRQVKALACGELIVERTLRTALAPFDDVPLGFLDFETVARAVPVWPAMAPWGMAAAQFSYHESVPGGGYRHVEHLAEGPQDARPLVAERLVEATRHAARVVAYSPFEKTRIRALIAEVPALAPELAALEAKLVDLLPVLRDHVCHPAFRGSFGLKHVLPALVPDVSYNDLVIVDGRLASVEIARLLFVADRVPPDERDRVRHDLLAYCERDTWAMVRLLETLRTLCLD